jgi:DNA-binding HxlR family transcriptional regulator
MNSIDQRPQCDQVVRAAVIVTGKWRLAIVCALGFGPVRSGELRRLFPAASKKVIQENLTEMETLGLVIRRERGGRPRHVEYELAESIRDDALKVVEHVIHLVDRLANSRMSSTP